MVVRAILFPGSNIILASKTKKQAELIITEKIVPMMNKYPNLSREIKKYHTGNNVYLEFWNGSKIMPTVAGDGARGLRGNVLVVDEFRLVNLQTIRMVLKPTLTSPRHPGYLYKKEYKHLTEENNEIYLSSAWLKSHFIWDWVKSYMFNMVEGKPFFCIVLPWQLSLYHSILTRQKAYAERDDEGMDETTFKMEYEALFPGEAENAFFTLKSIQKCRTLTKPFYPMSDIEYLLNQKKKEKDRIKPYVPKEPEEIRLIIMDVARESSTKKKKNDTTAFTCIRLLPNLNGYERHIVYQETLEGVHFEDQAIRLKKIFYDFDGTYAVIDGLGVGKGAIDFLTISNHCPKRDVIYPAWAPMKKDMISGKIQKDAPKVIYPIKATVDINHDIAIQLRAAFESKKIKMLISANEAKEDLIENADFMLKSPQEKHNLILPFRQADAFQNELVNLVQEYAANGRIKLEAEGASTKDRLNRAA